MENQFSNSKIFYHASLEKIINDEITLPSVIELSVSGLCNQDCKYCCNQPFRNNSVLSVAQIDSIIDQIAPFVKAVTITGGGEPTTNESLLHCLQRLREKTIDYGIITNGVNLSRCQMDEIADNAFFCRISLDSVQEDMYNRIRQTTNNLSTVLHNIEYIYQRKNQVKTKLRLGAQIILAEQKADDLEITIKQMNDLGIDFLQIRPVDNVPYMYFKPDYDMVNQNKELLDQLKAKYDSENFEVILSLPKFEEYAAKSVEKNYIGCPGGNLTSSIGHDYKVYFCCAHIGNEAYCLGDLNNNSLYEILLSQKRADIIRRCSHVGCQFQCRNHTLNKIIHELKQKTKEERDVIFEKVDYNIKPMHWQFL